MGSLSLAPIESSFSIHPGTLRRTGKLWTEPIELAKPEMWLSIDSSWQAPSSRRCTKKRYGRDCLLLPADNLSLQVFKDGLRVASERATNRGDQYFADDAHKLFDLDQPLVMHDLRQREAAMDPSNPFLKYPEEIKNQRLAGVLGFTKHDILYANMTPGGPEIIDVESPSNSTKLPPSADPSPAELLRPDVAEDPPSLTEVLEVAESSSEESEESSQSDSDGDSDLVDSDCEEERCGKYSRLKRVATREVTGERERGDTPKSKPQERVEASVVDLTEESDDELEGAAAAVQEITDLVGHCQIAIRREGNEESENFPLNAAAAVALPPGKDSNRKSCGEMLKSAAELMRFDALSPAALPSQCPMTPEVAKEYDEAIALGQRLEGREEYLVATKHYLAALNLCDADVELHRKLFQLKSKLETAAGSRTGGEGSQRNR
jgi:hypothetical protein